MAVVGPRSIFNGLTGSLTATVMDATKLPCRVRCFGLPLYSAMAREALAERLGLLLHTGSKAFGMLSVPLCPTLGGTKV